MSIFKMTRKVVAICGKARCGKDTIANIFESHGYVHLKIAGQLKEVTKLLFGFTHAQVESDNKDVLDTYWGITPRKALQFVGTEMMQYKIQELLPHIGRNFWITNLIKQMDTEYKDKNIIISDMRFLHEYEELSKCNLYVIKVDRPNQTTITDSMHVSEKEFEHIPHSIYIANDSSVESLQQKVNDIINQI